MAHANQLAFSESLDDTDEDKISAGSALDIQWYKQLQSFPTNRRNSELDWINDEVKDIEGKICELLLLLSRGRVFPCVKSESLVTPELNIV